MGNEFIQRKAFINYLHKDLEFTEGSANSYATYIAQVSKVVDRDGFYIRLNRFIEDGASEKIGLCLNQTLEFLCKKNIEEIINKNINDIRKWRSALPVFRDFLCDLADENDNSFDSESVSSEVEADLEFEMESGLPILTAREWTFDKEVLFSNFTFRLITQDRHYDKIYFPISFIKRIFYKNYEKKYFDDWTKRLVGDILIHTHNGPIPLKDITSINIKVDINGIVYNSVVVNGEEFALLTKTSTGAEMKMQKEQLNKIVIDHEISMKSIMHDSFDSLPTMSILTARMSKIIIGTATNKKLKSAGSHLLKKEVFGKDIVEGLKLELNHLLPLMKLQLMDARENSIKGAK